MKDSIGNTNIKFKEMSYKELEKDFKEKLDQYTDEELVKSLEDSIGNKSADEIFEKLGYKKSEEQDEIRYSYLDKKENYNNIDIIFYKRDKQIEAYYPKCRDDYESDSAVLTMQELQAINKKCQEMGWI